MATTLATRLQLILSSVITGADPIFGPESYQVLFPFLEDALTDGSTIDKANKPYKGTFTLSASGVNSHDLYGGLTDPFGNTLNFTRIVAIVIWNTSTTVGANLEVGGAASHAWESWNNGLGSTEKIGPNGVWLKWEPSAAGMVVANGTGDILDVTNIGATSITYHMMIVGS